jgi:hypothetical protein
MLCAVCATEELPIGLHAMSDDPAAAMAAGRRNRVNGAFEAVEDMGLTRLDQLERLVVIVSANFTPCHRTLLGGHFLLDLRVRAACLAAAARRAGPLVRAAFLADAERSAPLRRLAADRACLASASREAALRPLRFST